MNKKLSAIARERMVQRKLDCMQYADVIKMNLRQYLLDFVDLGFSTYQQTRLINSPSKTIVVGGRRKKPILKIFIL